MKQGKIRHIEEVVLTSPPMISRLRNVNVSKKRLRIPFLLLHTVCPIDQQSVWDKILVSGVKFLVYFQFSTYRWVNVRKTTYQNVRDGPDV